MSNQEAGAAGVALLMMDYQNTIVESVPEPARGAIVDNAARLLATARAAGVPIFHVAVKFRAGYPEVSANNKGFSAVKAAGRLQEDTAGADFHARLVPLQSEPVVVKRRVSAFGTTDLDALLRAANTRTLVLAGLVTGGVVLSTLRMAADLDYALVVAKDACGDPDEEVHRVLVDKVFARQASVVTTAEAEGVLKGR